VLKTSFYCIIAVNALTNANYPKEYEFSMH
jgi:hypothetical protein